MAENLNKKKAEQLAAQKALEKLAQMPHKYANGMSSGLLQDN